MERDGDDQPLRDRAEARYRSRKAGKRAAKYESTDDLLHDLEVHQIELEMQNEELLRAQGQLQDALARYQDLFDLAPVGYVVLRANGAIVSANLTAATLLGVDRLGLTRGRLQQYVQTESQDVLYRHLKRVFAGAGRETCELELVREPGGRFVARLESTRQRTGENREPECLTALTDVTQPKIREEALLQSQAQLRLLVEQAPISIALLDRNMNYLAASRRWVAEYGRGHRDLTGHNHYALHPDLPETWKQIHRQALAGAILKNDEDLWIQEDGSRHWLRWAVHPWSDQRGDIGGIIISAENITGRKEAEEELLRSQADLNRAQAVGLIGSWRLDMIRNELTWSEENHRIFGVAAGTPLTYESFLATVHPDDRTYVDRKWQAALRGEPYDIEHRLIVGGEIKWVRERAELEFESDGTVRGGFGTTQDVTQRKRTENALRAAKEEAERANVAKTRFLAAVSHDLRQPLQTLSLLNGVLVRKTDDAGLRDIIARQSSALSAMKQLLDVFMDMDRISTGVIKPVVSNFPVEDLLEELRKKFEMERASRNLDLRIRPCSAIIRSDPDMLGRILQNLVSNAIKYTDQGRVLIGCRRRGSDLSIEVWDTGPGIPAESLELIFHDFVQLSNPARQRTRGVGLGLSVARSLAQLLEHSLNVRSTPGKGSVFSVKVPQARSVAPSAGGDSIPKTVRYTGPPGAWILVVEDDPDVMKATSLLLKNLGLRAIEASSGVEAITMLGRQRTEPDLIIVDYQLPDGSGIDIIEQVRRFFGSIMPAVLVAGDTSRNAMSKMEESGSVVLHKPIRADELVVQLNRLLRDRG
jgi:PAS domain S-box-containing protein